MTPEQLKQFNIYGCAIRSILELCQRRQRTISADDVLNEFYSKYPQWFSQPGLTSVMWVCEICKALGIAGNVKVTTDKKQVIRAAKQFNDRQDVNGVLIFEERNLEPTGEISETNHCMLLLETNEQTFKVWCPNRDGSSSVEDFPWEAWKEGMMHALVLTI